MPPVPYNLDRSNFGHPSDWERYQKNVDAGVELCDRCDGCGNELFSMFRACEDCGGTGRLER